MPKEGTHDGWKVRRIRPQFWGWRDPIRKREHCPVDAAGGLITLSYGLSRLEARQKVTYNLFSGVWKAPCEHGRGRTCKVLVCFTKV